LFPQVERNWGASFLGYLGSVLAHRSKGTPYHVSYAVILGSFGSLDTMMVISWTSLPRFNVQLLSAYTCCGTRTDSACIRSFRTHHLPLTFRSCLFNPHSLCSCLMYTLSFIQLYHLTQLYYQLTYNTYIHTSIYSCLAVGRLVNHYKLGGCGPSMHVAVRVQTGRDYICHPHCATVEPRHFLPFVL